MGAEVRVLGPVEALVDGRMVDLRGKRSRQVLAALAVDVGHSVSVERLVDLVWSEDPPTTARTQVSIQISALRRALGEAEAGSIETTTDGYRLRADVVRVDAAEAVRALQESREADDLEDAVERLRGALGLWRAPPLSGLLTPGLEAAVNGLRELRSTLAEELYEAELALGHHREVIAELRAVVDEEPLQERFRAQFMTALWRSGRRADALEVYHGGRSLLVDQLGIEPGERLRELHEAILADDRPADGQSGDDRPQGDGEPRPVPAVPAELPADVPALVGRGAQVSRLLAHLSAPTASVSAVTGPGGIGKSALAVHVAHRAAASFTGGQLYVNLHGSTPNVKPLEPAEALGRMLRSLGADEATIPTDTEEAATRFRSMTAARRLLVVLDNARDVAQVTPLVPADRTCRVLVTSRRILTDLPGAQHERLDVLPESEAMTLLAGLVGPDRADEEAARDVVRRCGHLPLAIVTAASRLISRPSWTMRTLADRLRRESRRLRELRTEKRGVYASFLVSYRELDYSQRRMLRLMSLLDCADLGVPVAAAMAGIDYDAAEDLLENLVDVQLAESRAPGRYRTHDLLRLFARERAETEDTDDERGLAIRRAMHWYLATARTACVLLNRDAAWRTTLDPRILEHEGSDLRGRDEVYAWLDAERENLHTVVRQAIRLQDPQTDGPAVAAAMCSAVSLGLTLRGRHRDRVALGELVLDSASRTGDQRHLAVAHDGIGLGLLWCGDHGRALEHLTRACTAYRAVGDEAGEAVHLAALATANRLLERYPESILCSRQAIELNRRLGRPTALVDCLTSLGLVYRKVGRSAEEIEAHTEALTIAETLDERNWPANVLSNLAEAHRLAGDPHQARVHFEQALVLSSASERTQTFLDAEIHWGLGRIDRELGEVERARRHECRSADILCELGLIDAVERDSIAAATCPAPPDVIRRNT